MNKGYKVKNTSYSIAGVISEETNEFNTVKKRLSYNEGIHA